MTATTTSAARPTVVAPARAALGVGAALAVNVALFLVGGALGATFDVGQAQPASVVAVVVTTVLTLGIGLAVLALVVRRRPGLQRPASWAGLAFAVLSVAAPLTMAAETTTGATLAAMHLATGATWFALTRPRATR